MSPSSWNAGGNWQSTALGGNLALPGLRGVPGDSVLFQSGTGALVSLNGASPTLGGMTFNSSATSYTIALGSGGSMLLNNSSNSATIQVIAGSHSIQSGISLSSNLAIDTAANSSLSISGAINGGSQSLAKTGAGTLTLTGANTFTGGTSVLGGSLIVQTGASLGGSLAIGDGATVTIAASDANGNPLESVAAPRSAAVATSTASAAAPINTNSTPLRSSTSTMVALPPPSTSPPIFNSRMTAPATAERAIKKPLQFVSFTCISAPPDAARIRHLGARVIQEKPQINAD
jgi:autotransporter-associated beta strand protein